MDNAFKKTINVGTDAYYKNQMENITKENKLLKYKLDVLERENKDLKKSIYDLSVRYDMLMHQIGKTAKPFNVESIFENYIPGRDINIVDTNADETTDQIPESVPTRKVDERHFYYKYTLKGHTGAVYTSMFSPCGKFIASGSFDKTARIWDIANQHEATVLSGHSHSVSELTWSKDSQELLTGGFDKTIRLWDITQAQLVKGYLTSGFVQAVAFHPTDTNIFFASNTHKRIIIFDRRQARCVAIFENDSMVNTMHISKGGNHILSGDARGFLKVWDTRVALNVNANVANGPKGPSRDIPEPEADESIEGDAVLNGPCVDAEPHAPRATQGGVVDSMDIGDSNKPISHLHVSKGNDSEGRYLAVNSYSNVLRVYDRGVGTLSAMVPIGTFSSHKNQNWPIKSSFFVGKGYQSTLTTQEESNSKEDEDDEEDNSIDIHSSFLIATGSADNNAYIYDVGRSKEGGKLLQRLEGHTDKVYSVNFHPFEPIIASCSSDFTVRLWSPRKKIYV